MYEHKELLREAIDIVEDMDQSQSMVELTTAIYKVIKILDSMDMSLDLVYSAVSGHEGPISSIRSMQKHYGRAMAASRAPAPAGTEE